MWIRNKYKICESRRKIQHDVNDLKQNKNSLQQYTKDFSNCLCPLYRVDQSDKFVWFRNSLLWNLCKQNALIAQDKERTDWLGKWRRKTWQKFSGILLSFYIWKLVLGAELALHLNKYTFKVGLLGGETVWDAKQKIKSPQTRYTQGDLHVGILQEI